MSSTRMALVTLGLALCACSSTEPRDPSHVGYPAHWWEPVDDDDARRMLLLLSGRIHRVHTGVSVVRGDEVRRSLVTTQVEFSTLADTTIDWYIGTAEPIDKAGGYAIQGAGGALVTRIDGSVSNVIGLPLAETLALVRSAATRFV